MFSIFSISDFNNKGDFALTLAKSVVSPFADFSLFSIQNLYHIKINSIDDVYQLFDQASLI